MTRSCFNRAPYEETLVVQDGWLTSVAAGSPVGTVFSRRPRMVVIANANSKGCMQTKEPDCQWCRWLLSTTEEASGAET